MINFASDVLTQQKRFDEAATNTAEGVEFDPLLDLAWVLRSRYYLGAGDLAAAEAAAKEAKRVQTLYPEGASDPALVETLVNDINWLRSRGRSFRLPQGVAHALNAYCPRMATNDGRVVRNFVVQAPQGEPLANVGMTREPGSSASSTTWTT